MKKKILTCTLLLSWHALAGAAAEDSSPLESVIVTATRSEIPVDDALAPVILIGRDEIERSQAADISDLLRFHAGLDIARNGGPGQNTSLFVRGTESNHSLILIDGVEMNRGTIGGASIQNIPLDSIERIEIVKGPRSALYDSKAIGAVVNIITRRADAGTRFNAGTRIGRYDTRELNIGVDHGKGGLKIGGSVYYYDTDGFPTFTSSNIDRGHDKTSVNFYSGYDWNASSFEFRYWQSEGTTEYLDFSGNPLDQDFSNRVAAIEWQSELIDNWQSSVNLSHIVDDLEQNQANFLGDFDFAETQRNVLDWQNNFALGDINQLTAGLYLSREDTESSSFGLGFDESTDVDAIYVQDWINIGANTLLLAARLTDHETFGNETTWSIEYGRAISEKMKFTATAGTAFRAPDSTDRFGFGGNPDLEPEQSTNIEFGIRYRINNAQRISFSLFQNEIDDLIAFVDPDGFLGPAPGENQNIDEARIRGLDISYELALRDWRLRTAAIFQDTEDEATGEPLARRADRSVTASLTRLFGKHELGFDLLATDERKDSPFSTTTNAGYVLVNLTGRYQVNERWSVLGRIENLLDTQYETAAGFNSPDRGVYISVRYNSK